MIIRRQRTEDRGQTVVCHYAARSGRLRRSIATKRADYVEFRGTARPLSSVFRPLSSERGFSLISAIFLLVVIAALGTFSVTLFTTQQQGQSMDLMGARGYQAALAGIEWAAFNVTQQPAGTLWVGCASAPPATVTVGGNLAPFSPVTVSCRAAPAVEGTSTIWVYDVSSVAHTTGVPGNVNYVEQMATAKMAK